MGEHAAVPASFLLIEIAVSIIASSIIADPSTTCQINSGPTQLVSGISVKNG